MHDAVLDYAVRLVLATREPAHYGLADLDAVIAHGASPRATLGLVAAGRALALLRGRAYVLPQDVYDVARDVLRHRVLLSYEALADGVRRRRRRRAHRCAPSLRAPRHADPGRPRVGGGVMAAPTAAAPTAPTLRANDVAPAESTLRQLELRVLRKLDGLLHGDHLGLVPAAGHRGRRRSAVPPGRRRPPHRLEPHRPHRTSRTSATRSPTASSRRGSSSTGPRASTSGPRRARSATSRSPRPPPSGSSPRAGNRLGAVLCGRGPVTVPPRPGRDAVLALLQRVATTPRTATRPRAAKAIAESGPAADLRTALRAVGPLARRRGLVVVISDFLDPAGWERLLRSVRGRHEVLAVEVVDPRELDLPAVGLLTLVDPETGRRLEVQTREGNVRAATPRRRQAARRDRRALAAAGSRPPRAAHGPRLAPRRRALRRPPPPDAHRPERPQAVHR